jgi:2-haloacid dehalogenase
MTETERLADVDPSQPARGPRRPAVLVFDVNETLSDMAPLADRFSDIGAVPQLAKTWFAGLLRDGFALTVNSVNPDFATLAREQLRQALVATSLEMELEAAVEHVMGGFAELQCHPDVIEGVRALSEMGLRLVTLTNGAASVAQRLFGDAGIADRFDRLLSVQEAQAWKPDARAYRFALEECRVESAEAMLVAAHPWDTDGARRAGLTAAWINRESRTYPSYFLAPDIEARSLIDLAAVLR